MISFSIPPVHPKPKTIIIIIINIQVINADGNTLKQTKRVKREREREITNHDHVVDA